jgi:hypothetical protein
MEAAALRNTLDGLLADFGRTAGIEGLATNEQGVCILVFDPGTHLNLMADPSTGTVVLWSPLGDLPAGRRAETLELLMRANLFWKGTQGATVGLMPDSDEAVLAYRLPLEGLGVEALRGAIELMVESAEDLVRRIGDAGTAPAVPTGAPEPDPIMLHAMAIRG